MVHQITPQKSGGTNSCKIVFWETQKTQERSACGSDSNHSTASTLMKPRYTAHQLSRIINESKVPAVSDQTGSCKHRHNGWIFVSRYEHTDSSTSLLTFAACFPKWVQFERIISPEGDVFPFPPPNEITSHLDAKEVELWHALTFWQAVVEVRQIVCAAYRKDGKIFCAPRHDHPIMLDALSGSTEGAEMGFVDQFGFFLDPHEAWEVAERAYQIRYRKNPTGPLLPEHLY